MYRILRSISSWCPGELVRSGTRTPRNSYAHMTFPLSFAWSLTCPLPHSDQRRRGPSRGYVDEISREDLQKEFEGWGSDIATLLLFVPEKTIWWSVHVVHPSLGRMLIASTCSSCVLAPQIAHRVGMDLHKVTRPSYIGPIQLWASLLYVSPGPPCSSCCIPAIGDARQGSCRVLYIPHGRLILSVSTA